MTANPKRALDLNINASLEFLRKVMPSRTTQINRAMQPEGLLETNMLEQRPDEHRPAKKYIGGRLKIPHEFTYRFVPGVTRKLKRRARASAPQASDEVWMHAAPSKEELEARGVHGNELRSSRSITAHCGLEQSR